MAGVEGGIVAFLGRGNISRPFLEGVKMVIFEFSRNFFFHSV